MSARSPLAPIVGWRSPGGPWTEGSISAKEAKAIGATITVTGNGKRFEINHKDNWGDERFPWRLFGVIAVGEHRSADSALQIDEFPSLRESVTAARKMARR
jgi:hypothetical protein